MPSCSIGFWVASTRNGRGRSYVLPPMVPKLTDIKVISYDFAKYGSSATRKRLLERWEKEINASTK